jgi:hypothetical protein
MVPAVSDRATAEVATYLVALYGEEAGAEAAARASVSRNRGNVQHFCRWRQVERFCQMLSVRQASGTIH